MSGDKIDPKVFARESNRTLQLLDTKLGDLDFDNLDVELSGDVLTLTFDDKKKFIINAHSAAEQIWMAAGTTAWHFDYVADKRQWFAHKTQEELLATVAKVVGAELKTSIDLFDA